MLTRTLAAAIAAALLSTAALAHEVTVGALELSDLWTRATPPGAPTAAGYLTIANNGGEVDRLIAVSTPHAARGEIHEMAVTGGVMTMKPVDDIGIAPGESVTLAPGGLHLMFMGLTEPLTTGGIMAVTLTFENAGSVETYLHVVAVGAFAPEGEHEHGDH